MSQFKRAVTADDDYGWHSATLHEPFDWEETPGTPKGHLHLKPEVRRPMEDGDAGGGGDLEFDFGGLSDRCMIRGETASAGELFEGGKIKPLKLPPRLECGSGTLSARWAKSPAVTSPCFRSPRQRAKVDEFDPFEDAIELAISNSRSKGHTMEGSDLKGDNIMIRRRTSLEDILPKATPEEKRCAVQGSIANQSSSALLLPNKLVARGVKFSSFRSIVRGVWPLA